MRVLVVDDVRPLALILRQLIEGLGHTAAAAYDGREAIAAAKRFAPDVVLCDLNLDVGLSGYEVAGQLRAEAALRSVYLVAVSGCEGEEEVQKSLAAGFDAHLVKPVGVAELEQVLAVVGDRGAR